MMLPIIIRNCGAELFTMGLNYADYEALFLLIVAVPAIIGELSLTFWLLLKGVNIEQWEQRVAQATDKW
jgi:hypothetical protein